MGVLILHHWGSVLAVTSWKSDPAVASSNRLCVGAILITCMAKWRLRIMCPHRIIVQWIPVRRALIGGAESVGEWLEHFGRSVLRQKLRREEWQHAGI